MPLEKRKKMFTKECKAVFIAFLCDLVNTEKC